MTSTMCETERLGVCMLHLVTLKAFTYARPGSHAGGYRALRRRRRCIFLHSREGKQMLKHTRHNHCVTLQSAFAVLLQARTQEQRLFVCSKGKPCPPGRPSKGALALL